MELLTYDTPPTCSALLRRWREAAMRAHHAECRQLENSLDHSRSGTPLDGELAANAIELRRAANEARRDAMDPAHFGAAVLWLVGRG